MIVNEAKLVIRFRQLVIDYVHNSLVVNWYSQSLIVNFLIFSFCSFLLSREIIHVTYKVTFFSSPRTLLVFFPLLLFIIYFFKSISIVNFDSFELEIKLMVHATARSLIESKVNWASSKSFSKVNSFRFSVSLCHKSSFVSYKTLLLACSSALFWNLYFVQIIFV